VTKNLGGQLAKGVGAIYITDAKIAVTGATSAGSPMSALSLVLNLLWIIFGGLWMAFGWVIAGIVMAITIIGLPWARAAFNIASYTLLPFGYKAVSRAGYSGREDIGTGPFGLLGNIIWLVLAGWWLALGHVVTAVLLAVTIIGIPFAWAHLKLAGLALWPIGKMIVPADDTALPYARRW
jgi:uncharacterized membrane protein YccF (DUF307 family)